MKVAWMERFGDPAEVLACQELPEPDAAGPGEVLLQLAASPINPADFFLGGPRRDFNMSLFQVDARPVQSVDFC